ncbi:hypothetical protein D3C74_404830 [compost metagenome]
MRSSDFDHSIFEYRQRPVQIKQLIHNFFAYGQHITKFHSAHRETAFLSETLKYLHAGYTHAKDA